MLISLIGRTNVGKSTLFNVLVNNIKSFVSCTPGTTRDRIYGNFLKFFNTKIVDTGAIINFNDNKLINKVINNSLLAINESNIVFLIIIGNSFNNKDYEFYKYLINLNKKIILIINKIDIIHNYYNFKYLKLEKIFYISAKYNIGIKNLYKYIIYISKKNIYKKKTLILNNNKKIKYIKTLILGNENVGKSTFFNRLLNCNRSITSNISGTTLNNIENIIKYNNKNFLFIDTRGLYKKFFLSKFNKYIFNKNLINSNIIIFIIDVTNEFTKYDIFLIKYIYDYKKPIFLIFNKIDLLNIKEKNLYKNNIEKKLSFIINNIKIFYISAIYLNNINYIINFIYKLHIFFNKKYKSNYIDKILKIAFDNYFVNYKKNKKSLIFKKSYILKNSNIKIFIYINDIYFLKNSFKKYLYNFIIKNLYIKSIPIKIIFKKY